MQCRVSSVLFAMVFALPAQQTLVLPPAANGAEGPGRHDGPWRWQRNQLLYPAAMFASQGIDYPIRITRIRWRADGGTWAPLPALTIGNVAMRLATAPNSFLSSTFAENLGRDQATVFTGPVVTLPTSGATPNSMWVDLATSPFDYDPFSGRGLVVDLVVQPGFGGITPQYFSDAFPGGDSCWAFAASATTAVDRWQQLPVVELTFTAVHPLLARFTAAPVSGPSPLTVAFSDRSVSMAAGGIQVWAWDFDNDGVVDSTARNPTHVYATCGDYSVTLVVVDALNSHWTTANGLVRVDPLTASFETSPGAGTAPLTVAFADTSIPTPTAWAWDFDDDGNTDSTARNPSWTFPTGWHRVRLTASRGCRVVTKSRAVAAGRSFVTSLTSQDPLVLWPSGLFFDLDVLAADGITVTGLTLPANSGAGADVYLLVTEGSHVGLDTDASRWRIGGVARVPLVPSGTTPVMALDPPLYLAQGRTGCAIYSPGTWLLVNSTNAAIGNADLVLDRGRVRRGWFGGTLEPDRQWCCGLFYSRAVGDGVGGHGFVAAGCPGSGGQYWLRSRDGMLPRLGRTLVASVDHLPATSPGMLAMTGLSRTTSPFGTLPLDLAPFGMPGCRGLVRPDLVQFVPAAVPDFALAIPNAPFLQGLPFFQQAIVLDPALNAAGAAASDAAAAVIGN